ncbi:MAG TPA: hypothetical protein VES62_07265 [Thermoleophilaceae bacterium]|nr:hypothetical protein [Thermoleophilaceae bacterium]
MNNAHNKRRPGLVRLKRLTKKNYRVAIRRLEPDEWQKVAEADPEIPRSFSELRRLGRQVFKRAGRARSQKIVRPVRGFLRPAVEECGETPASRFFLALSNPLLSLEQLDALDADIDADVPVFDQSLETAHFILRWTNASANAADNIADNTIIDDTANYLEAAWVQYNPVFGAPYVAPGLTKIDVVFWDIAGLGFTTPGGPINLDAPNWVAQLGVRQPTSAHELFHRVQYAYGYRTTWTPAGAYQWFSEGSASWGEVFVWSRVSGSYKITDLFTNPDLNLWNASYSALPFWIFFQIRQQDFAGDNAMLSFLQRYQTLGNERTAVAQIIDEDWPPNNVYGQLDTFFALFARDRVLDHWRLGPSGGAYPAILAPNGVAIAPALAVTAVPLGAGDTYVSAGVVSALGTDYYRFAFQSGSTGHDISLSSVVPAGGDYSYYLIWEKAGSWVRAEFPFVSSGNYSLAQTLDLSLADALVVAISGRGLGGPYTLNASVT